MGIFIKNPDVEQATRELARLRGESLTQVIGEAVSKELLAEKAKQRPRPTLAEMKAATVEFRRKAGLDRVKLGVTRADFDALWEGEETQDGPA